MKFKLIPILLGLILMASCKPSETKQSDEKDLEQLVEASELPTKRAFSNGSYNFQIDAEESIGRSSLDVIYEGKKVEQYEFDRKIISEQFVDLNGDKHNELILILEDKAGAKAVKVYSLINGSSISVIKEELKDMDGFEVEACRVDGKQIVETFAYKDAEGNPRKKDLRYNLVAGESGFKLMPQGWNSNELEHMQGQYASRDAEGAGYYKVMLISKNEMGEWVVDIKVKRNGTKEVICDFIGVGNFRDKDLFVPLNYKKTALQGTLQIRFLDLMAVVYTKDPSNSKEMIAFCNGEGSIAGNFKKTNI